MRITPLVRSALLGAASLIVATAASAQVVVSVSVGGPPALPVYDQPPVPAAGYMWTPGYWAYDADDGYYWVPGTWVMAPEPGLLWTPGYWGWGDAGYTWYPGYWATQVGFYGGIDYGYGYGGVGYEGGHWDNGAFYYNRSVTHIDNTTNITNVYNKTVINNTSSNNVSFNGGNGGTSARPTPAEEAVAHERHVDPTSAQTQHQHEASTNRAQWASANHGKPGVVATPKPGEFSGKDVVTASRETRTYRATSAGEVSKSGAPAAHPKEATAPQPKNEARPEANPNAKEPPKANEHPNTTEPPSVQEHPEAKDQRKPEQQPKRSTAPEEHKASPAPEEHKSSPPPEEHKSSTPPDQHKASTPPQEHKAPPPDQPKSDQKKQENPPGNG